MIPVSEIHDNARSYIKNKLLLLEAEENIEIILAIESGSRAWGFPSKDSDYDVRFLYRRNRDDYLSIEAIRDVVETPLVHDQKLGVPLDMNGWDLRKVLQLGLKSNAVSVEWLRSPVVYFKDEEQTQELLNFFQHNFNLKAVQYHYERLALAGWNKSADNMKTIGVKKYCYLLRPALAINWIKQNQQLPPMDVHNLSKCQGLTSEFLQALEKLISRKSNSDEGDHIDRLEVFDTFIQEQISDLTERQNIETHQALRESNRLFRKMICKPMNGRS